jgi:hypothetical protein
VARMQLVEIEDEPWCPAPVREGITDILAFMGMLAEAPLAPFADRLAEAMKRAEVSHIVDLCSGGGGPVVPLVRLLGARGVSATVTFTDLYPNLPRLRYICEKEGRAFGLEEEAVDATAVPDHLRGFRLLCNSFHHFPPEQARRILADAVRKRQGVGVLEVVSRTPGGMLPVLFSPMSATIAVLFIRPFRLDRWFLTFIVPVLQVVTLWDGIVSCLRVYDPDELRALVESLRDEGVDPDTYEWTIARENPPGAPVPLTMLLGVPKG